MINLEGMEETKEAIRGMDKDQAIEIKEFLDGFVEALGGI